MAKLLNAAKAFIGRSSGSERIQLEATLKECVGVDELRQFLTRSKDVADHFAKGKQIKVRTLSVHAQSADLLKETAERVYQIRCRIVHAKGTAEEEEEAPLLPYTKEEQSLGHDISLIKFLAFKVITASGSTFKM